MNAGNIEQVGTPQEMYETPATRFVAGFIGSPAMNFIPCEVVADGGVAIRFAEALTLPVPPERHARYKPFAGQSMLFGIRPEHFTEKKAHTHNAMTDFTARVDVLEPMGMDTMVFVNLNGEDVCARAAPQAVTGVGQDMAFSIDMSRMHLIDPRTDKVV
jgi:multiple sugar transport system ATP-binding protein